MNRNTTVLVVVIFVVASMLLAGHFISQRRAAAPAGAALTSADPAGRAAPDFELKSIDGKSYKLADLRGKAVLLNFWATWCPPCIEETPSLVRMTARMKDKGVVVLAVSIDADDAAYHRFLKDYSVNMITVRDEARKASDLYGTFGWPESYIIDRKGVIRRKFIGPVEWNSPEIIDYLSKL